MANGQLDLSTLVEVQPGKYLQHDTAAAFRGLDALSRSKYGIALTISEGGAYRTLAEQTRLRNEWVAGGKVGYPPAIPGNSNHGTGTAVDIWNWTHLTDADLRQFGFVRDVYGEGWHAHYIGSITAASTVTEQLPTRRGDPEMHLFINVEGKTPATFKETGGAHLYHRGRLKFLHTSSPRFKALRAALEPAGLVSHAYPEHIQILREEITALDEQAEKEGAE